MSLTPEDILGKRFHDAFRGYNHEEVDVFLDEVAVAFEAAFKDLQAARARAEELEGQVLELKGTEGMLKRTLLAAQRAADETVAEAKTEAARLVSVAEDEAAAVVASAKQQTEDIIAVATARQSEIEQLGSRLHGLQAAHVATLRAHLEEQLQALDNLPAPPDPVLPANVDAAPGTDDAAPGTDPETDLSSEPAHEEPADNPESSSESSSESSPESSPESSQGPKMLTPAASPPADSPESSAEAPKPASSPPASGRPAVADPGTGGERPPSRRVPREPLRPGGPTGGSVDNGEPSARVQHWGKD